MSSYDKMTPKDKKRLRRFTRTKKANRPTHANVCWYVGGIKRETIHYNISTSMAYAIKNRLKNHPRFSVGEIRVETL